MVKIEDVKKVISKMKIEKRDNGKFSSIVIAVTLITGKVLDVRIKNYAFGELLDTAGADVFKITYETRKTKEGKDFDCFVVSAPALEYELLEFLNREQEAIIKLTASKK